MKNKIYKKTIIFLMLFAVLFSNMPYQAIVGALSAYNKSLNIVDKLWGVANNKNVVDNFISWKAAEKFKVPVAYAAVGDARMQYGRTTNASPNTRLYDSAANSWGASSTTAVGTANVGWTISKESPTEDLTVLVTQSTTGKMDIFCRSGSTWTKDISNVTVGLNAATRRFDVEFEKTSGIPMVLYSQNATSTNELGYYRKTGAGCGAGSWTGPTNLDPTRVTSPVLWVELEARQTSGTNVMAAAFSDSNATAGGKLEAMIWNGSWGNESPAGAAQGWSDLSIEATTVGANTAKVFDIAFETNSGDLIVVWGTSIGANGTNGWRYATCVATLPCTWSAVQTPSGPLDDATNVAIAPDPGSDAVAAIGQGNGGNDLSAWLWTGSGVGATTAASADATLLTVAAGDMHVGIDWVVNGSQRMAVGVYMETTTGYKYIYYDTVGAAWRYNGTTGFTITGAPATAGQSVNVRSNPNDRTQLLVNFTDSASDLWSKRLTYDGAGGGATTALSSWSNADGGATLEGTVSSITSQSFWSEWVLTAPINYLTIGSTTGSQVTSLNSGDASQYMNSTSCDSASTCAAFTLSVNEASVTLDSIKVSELGTVNATNDLSNLALFYDTDGNYSNGTTGQFGATAASFDGSETATVSGSLTMNPDTTYYFYVRSDIKSGTPTYPAGGETINFGIASTSDVSVTGAVTKSGTPTLDGSTTVLPNATGTTWGAGLSDGARSGESITISGYGFGVAPGGSRDSCAGAVNTGCVKFVIGGNATVADGDITAWSNTSITFIPSSTLASNGGAAALEVVSGSQSDGTDLDFYVYPNITAVASLGSNAGREYDAGDTDGLIMLAGDHFGPAGSATILGSAAAEHGAAAGSCTVGGYSTTSTCLEIPTAISDSVNTGSIVLTRTSDSKTHTYANLRILPRITSLSTSTGTFGDAVTVNGNHFCQGGSCPSGFDVNNKVVFDATDATVFTSWTDTAIVTAVPTGATDGNIVVTSNTYTSDGVPFTVLSPIPNDPTSVGQYRDSGLTQAIATGDTASATPAYLKMAMQVDVSGGTLYPQVEIKDAVGNYVCGAGACGSATEGSGASGPGPSTGSVAVSPADGTYAWRARVRHNKLGADYYSNWVEYGGNGANATDFLIDTTPSTITFGGGNACADAYSNLLSNSVDIGWSLSESATGQVEYATSSSLANSSYYPASPAASALSHSISLNNLNSNTTYYFRVKSVDGSGILSQRPANSPFCSFTTPAVSSPAKTVRFFVDGMTGQLAASTLATSSFKVDLPENTIEDPVTIKSAYLEVTGITTSNGTNNIELQVNSQAATTTTMASNNNSFKVVYDISPGTLYLDGTDNVFNITPSIATNIISAAVIITYAYTP